MFKYRFELYGVVVLVVLVIVASAAYQSHLGHYGFAEQRYNCEQNFFLMQEVLRFGAMSPCAEFIDEYRFYETSAAGFDYAAGWHCVRLAADPRRVRDLVCEDEYSGTIAPAVSWFANRGRRLGDPLITVGNADVR